MSNYNSDNDDDGGYYNDDGYAHAGVEYGYDDYHGSEDNCPEGQELEDAYDEGQVDDGDGYRVHDQGSDDDDRYPQGDDDRYPQGDDVQEQDGAPSQGIDEGDIQEEAHDERFGYSAQEVEHQGQGDDVQHQHEGSAGYQDEEVDSGNGGGHPHYQDDVPQGEYYQDQQDEEAVDEEYYQQGDGSHGRGYEEFEINDTMGVYNNSNDAFQYSPSEYQQDGVEEEAHPSHNFQLEDDPIGDWGSRGNTVGYDEDYETMEALHRQQPAEYGGGDTINDDNEDYSNTLYRPPHVRAQIRRDREASRRRSRQQRGRGPDAEERKHE